MHVASTTADCPIGNAEEAIFPYARWYARLDELREHYRTADPFPHLVLDDFLQPAAAERFLAEFPPLDPEKWIAWVHLNNDRLTSRLPGSLWGRRRG